MARGEKEAADGVVYLSYRPPLDWRGLLDFYRRRAISGVEVVDGDTYRRTIDWQGECGTFELSPCPRRNRLQLRLEIGGRPTAGVASRLRRMFDLNVDPLDVEAALRRDPLLRKLVRARPGLRVPGAWDAFETAVRAILGQQVTVRAATTLCGRLALRFGRPIDDGRDGLTHLFPTPEALAEATLDGIGLTRARAATLSRLARAVAAGELRLDSAGGLDDAVGRLASLPGIGEWTAQYVALRAFGERDAFPAGDLGLRRALADGENLPTPGEVARRSEAWRPWRAYAAIHLWMSATANGVIR